MKIFIGGEIETVLYEQFRVARNTVLDKLILDSYPKMLLEKKERQATWKAIGGVDSRKSGGA
ncbi:hypothetical protein AGMMS50239_02440 [Bacteroidia bacterium]|nr:hypothetical protein AGMMS50239_02440 [Bacteroidia bacterium]